MSAPKTSALDVQVGGNHYKTMKIQPSEYCQANGIGFIAGNVIKYVSRYKLKGGRQDLEKALHHLQMLIELEYPEAELREARAHLWHCDLDPDHKGLCASLTFDAEALAKGRSDSLGSAQTPARHDHGPVQGRVSSHGQTQAPQYASKAPDVAPDLG